MAIKITTPNTQFTGKRAGILFRRGTATVETLTDVQIAGLQSLGYTVEEEKPATKAKAKATAKSGE